MGNGSSHLPPYQSPVLTLQKQQVHGDDDSNEQEQSQRQNPKQGGCVGRRQLSVAMLVDGLYAGDLCREQQWSSLACRRFHIVLGSLAVASEDWTSQAL